MPSFNNAIAVLITKLQADTALNAFCQAKWNRNLKVTKEFRHRTEITTAVLPLIMITRPTVNKEYRFIGDRQNTHIARLYCGFYQNDKKKALDELVEFEELIDDVMTNNYDLRDAGNNPTVRNVYPTASENDEGIYHPHYFMVCDVEIVHRR